MLYDTKLLAYNTTFSFYQSFNIFTCNRYRLITIIMKRSLVFIVHSFIFSFSLLKCATNNESKNCSLLIFVQYGTGTYDASRLQPCVKLKEADFVWNFFGGLYVFDDFSRVITNYWQYTACTVLHTIFWPIAFSTCILDLVSTMNGTVAIFSYRIAMTM